MKETINPEKGQRVVTFLRREEVDFLDKLGKDALFSTGLKLSRAKLIAWLVDLIQKLNINGEDIKSERDFENRILKVLQQQQSSHQPRPVRNTNIANWHSKISNGARKEA